MSSVKMLKGLARNSTFLLVAITLFGFAFRAWRIDQPAHYIFDEVYYAKYAGQYLRGENVFDAHPPGGRLILSLGSVLLGDQPIGWRIVPLVAGTALILLTYLVAFRLFRSKQAGLIAATLTAVDGMIFVYSRTSLLEVLLLLFVQGSLLGALAAYDAGRANRSVPIWPWIITGALFGLAVSVKWIGFGILPLLVGILVASSRRKQLGKLAAVGFTTLIMVPAVIYLTLFFLEPIPKRPNWQDIKNWHTDTWHYHRDLMETRSYNSAWWQWPFLSKPISFHYYQTGDQVQTVIALGNPLVWWVSSLAAAVTLSWLIVRMVRPRYPELPSGVLIALVGYLSFLLPWALVSRGLFVFHYLNALIFAIYLLSYWLVRLSTTTLGNRLAATCLLIAVFLFFYFLPILHARQISVDQYINRLWLPSWNP